MLFWRSIFFFFSWWTFTIFWTILSFIVCIFPNRVLMKTSRCWCKITLKILCVVCGVKHQIKGLENIPNEPVILLSKHQSAWETFFLFYALPRNVSFVIKKELLSIPFFGWVLRMLRMIPIDRKKGLNAFKQLVKTGNERLREGHWIAIFPEGTRMPPGEKGHYHQGGSMLAILTKMPVVPIALNTGECWPKSTFIKQPGTITISFGKTISSENKSPAILMNEVENWIENEMRECFPHLYPPKNNV